MKKLYLLLAFLSTCHVYSQDTTYYRSYDVETFIKEDASIFEVNRFATGEVRRYFLDGNIAMEGYSIENLIQGEVTKYHKNAGVFERSVYKNGKPYGSFKRWYPSGQLMGVFYGIPTEKQEGLDYFEEIREFYFENGKQSLREGSGFAQTFYFDGTLAEQGDILQGRKHGSWIGYNQHGLEIYRENYEKNKLIQGESYLEGSVYRYTEISVRSKYPGGEDAFNKVFLRIEHPQGNRRRRKTGTMFVFFVIERDGTYSNIRFYYSLGPKFETQVKKALFNSEKWTPGSFRGVPLRQQMVQTITFD